MSLGTGALKVSGVPKPEAARRYPWQPWKAGTTHCASANPHRHTERNSMETTYLKNTYLDQEQKGEGGEGSRIRNDSRAKQCK